jgi:hypothetical protein
MRRRSSSSSPRTAAGVRPLVTSLLMRACLGSHVQHDAGHRQVLNDRATVRAAAARLRGKRHGVVEHVEDLVVGRYGPEPFTVRGVSGWGVPPDRG